jgi:Raf kinase inhibitor-like YbhB/YbcL family protein
VKIIGIALLAILLLAAAVVVFSLTRAAKARDADQAYHATLPKTVILHSISFSAGSDIPASYTCKGEGVSPEISWEGVPDNSRSFVLVATDWDGPSPRFRLGSFTHWVLYNIPHGVHQIKSAVKTAELNQEQIDVGNNSSNAAGYKPPCPPLGKHRYLFRLYVLDVAQIHPSSPDRDSVMEAMRDHVLAFGEIAGLFGG